MSDPGRWAKKKMKIRLQKLRAQLLAMKETAELIVWLLSPLAILGTPLAVYWRSTDISIVFHLRVLALTVLALLSCVSLLVLFSRKKDREIIRLTDELEKATGRKNTAETEMKGWRSVAFAKRHPQQVKRGPYGMQE